jgi:hypothetical protein
MAQNDFQRIKTDARCLYRTLIFICSLLLRVSSVRCVRVREGVDARRERRRRALWRDRSSAGAEASTVPVGRIGGTRVCPSSVHGRRCIQLWQRLGPWLGERRTTSEHLLGVDSDLVGGWTMSSRHSPDLTARSSSLGGLRRWSMMPSKFWRRRVDLKT